MSVKMQMVEKYLAKLLTPPPLLGRQVNSTRSGQCSSKEWQSQNIRYIIDFSIENLLKRD